MRKECCGCGKSFKPVFAYDHPSGLTYHVCDRCFEDSHLPHLQPLMPDWDAVVARGAMRPPVFETALQSA